MTDRDREPITSAMPDKFDRALGRLHGLQHVLWSKPTTIRSTPPLGVGGSELFVVTTARQSGDVTGEGDDVLRTPSTFTIFLEIVDGDSQAKRIVIPNDVANLIARQRDALTSIAQKRAAKQAAATRKERGIQPAFLKSKSTRRVGKRGQQ